MISPDIIKTINAIKAKALQFWDKQFCFGLVFDLFLAFDNTKTSKTRYNIFITLILHVNVNKIIDLVLLNFNPQAFTKLKFM